MALFIILVHPVEKRSYKVFLNDYFEDYENPTDTEREIFKLETHYIWERVAQHGRVVVSRNMFESTHNIFSERTNRAIK